jgi:hypothetical protein
MLLQAFTVNHTISLPDEPRKPALPENYTSGDKLRFWPADSKRSPKRFANQRGFHRLPEW